MEIITRTQAVKLGKRTYFTGLPCKNGHVAPHITTTYRCTTCKSSWEHNRRLSHPDADRAIRKRESTKNRSSYKRRENAYWVRLTEKFGKRYVTVLRTEASSRRRQSELRATPIWYDKDKALDFYRQRDELTKITGIIHEVDHIVPLRGKNVCGLHWHGNLQVLTKKANNTKSGSFTHHSS